MTISKETEIEVSLHIAEYNAITTRVTYLMYVQYTLVLALIAWITVWISNWHLSAYYIWCVVGGMQILELFYLGAMKEIYRNNHYIELTLKPQIKSILGDKIFWQYETIISNDRGEKYMSTELLPTALTTIAFIIILTLYPEESIKSLLGLSLNIIVFVAIILWVISLKHIRIKYSGHAIAGTRRNKKQTHGD